MPNAKQPSGLMETVDQDNLAKLKKELLGEDKPQRSLDYRIGQLSDAERRTFENALQFTMFLQQQQVKRRGFSDMTHEDTVDAVNKGMSEELKQLVVEMLQYFLDIPIKPKPKEKYDGMSLYDRPEFRPVRDDETPAAFVRRPTQEPEQLSFLDRLVASESSGKTDAEIELDDGRKYVGLMQMGEARLEDYKRATNTSFTQEQFKNDTELQDKVGDWHLADIDKNIDAMGDDAKGYSRDGLRAVAHLGGVGGMKKYVKSKGQYNPSDQLGTSLSDYYNKFSGEA